MADWGFQYVFMFQKKKENMENYKNLRNIGYDMSLTLSCGAVSFLPPNFCLWFLVPSYPESYNQEKQVVLVFGSYPPRKGAPSASIVKTQAGNFKHGEDGEMTPPPERLVIVSTQWTADTLREITATA